MIRISIVVPIHNSEKYIQRCVESLIHQTMKDIEIILIDDASTDASKELIMKYTEMYPCLIKGFYLSESRHAGGARNVGIEHAQGEYITFVDSDDYIDERFCDLLYKEAQAGNYDIVFCDYSKGGESEEKKRYVSVFPEQIGTLNCNKRKSLLINMGYSCGMIVRNRIFKEHHIRYPEQIGCEDYCMRMLLFLYTKSIGKVNKPLYTYVIYDMSLSHQRNSLRHYDYEKSVKWLQDWMQINSCKENEEYLITGMIRQLLQEIKLLIKYFDEIPLETIQRLALCIEGLLQSVDNRRLFYMMGFGRELELVDNAHEDEETLRTFIEGDYDVMKLYQIQYSLYQSDILKQIKEWKQQGKEVIVWGAGKKAQCFLQEVGDIEQYITHIADTNSDKWGKKLLSRYSIVNPQEYFYQENIIWLLLNRRHYISVWDNLAKNSIDDKLVNLEILMTLCDEH